MSDPLDPVRSYLDRGGNLRELARASGVPHNTIHNWINPDRGGTPQPIVQAAKVLAALKAMGRRKGKA